MLLAVYRKKSLKKNIYMKNLYDSRALPGQYLGERQSPERVRVVLVNKSHIAFVSVALWGEGD